MSEKKAIIIGAGIAGLASAIRLRSAGWHVEILEANAYVGGKLTAFEQDGFRFDAGPSLFTLPELVDDLFRLAQKNPREYFNYQKLTVTTHYFFEDGTMLTAYADRKKWLHELEQKLSIDASTVENYLKRSAAIYTSVAYIFLENSLHRWRTWLSKSVARAVTKIHTFGLFQTMHGFNKKWLKHPKLIQLFNRYATYNGSNPYQAPGILTAIPHLEFNLGSYFPFGGMHAITKAIHQLALDLGVKIQLNSPVDEILFSGSKATAIRAKQKIMYADVIVCNMDIYHAYKKLMPSAKAPIKTLNQERSSSALIFYWGINTTFEQLHLHNVFFSADYKKEFATLFGKGVIDSDPTVYVNITSKLHAADAPAGKENWFVMINVPSNKGQAWDVLIQQARKNILAKLSRILKVEIEPLIISESILDPRSIETKTSSYQGSLYGTSSNGKFAAFLRHPNHSQQFANLFFCGGSVHPGGGIPLCLNSANIVCQWANEQFAKKIV